LQPDRSLRSHHALPK